MTTPPKRTVFEVALIAAGIRKAVLAIDTARKGLLAGKDRRGRPVFLSGVCRRVDDALIPLTTQLLSELHAVDITAAATLLLERSHPRQILTGEVIGHPEEEAP